MNIKDEITNGENLMNTKIETFLTYMLVLFLTIAFESYLRAAVKNHGLDLTFEGSIEKQETRDSAISIKDENDQEISALETKNMNTYNRGDDLIMDPQPLKVKVTISSGSVQQGGLTVEVKEFMFTTTAIADAKLPENLLKTATHAKWKFLVKSKNGNLQTLPLTTQGSGNKNKSAKFEPDSNNGSIYTVTLHPILEIPRNKIKANGGNVQGVVKMNFAADIQ